LLIVYPKQVSAHDPSRFQKKGNRIVSSERNN
jgi:hypothetical protein